MNIFSTIMKIIRPKLTDGFTTPVVGNLPPLSRVAKELLTPGETAFYCNLTGRELSQWEMGYGPIKPTTEEIDGKIWVRFRTADVRRLLGV